MYNNGRMDTDPILGRRKTILEAKIIDVLFFWRPMMQSERYSIGFILFHWLFSVHFSCSILFLVFLAGKWEMIEGQWGWRILAVGNLRKKENVWKIVERFSRFVDNNKSNVNTIITSNGSIEQVRIFFLFPSNGWQRFSPRSFQEDVILNEERTTEQERRAIHEGKFWLGER